jgi:hypothetical protein
MKSSVRARVLVLSLVSAAGCSGAKATTDGGPGVDAGPVDAGVLDAGPLDAGLDAGPLDAGPVDAGPVDAGPVDAGPVDAGPVDAGHILGSIDIIPIGGPVDLTTSGGTALLWDTASVAFDVYYYDTATRALTLVTSTGDFQNMPRRIAGDGSRFISDHALPIQPAIWSPDAGWHDQGTVFDGGCDPFGGGGFGLDGDGHVAVGLLYDGCATRAFRWTDASGAGVFKLLDGLGNNPGGADRASVVSQDGLVMGGFAATPQLDRTPALWRPDGSGVLLDPALTGSGEVLAINADGSMVAGILNQEAFSWTPGAGLVSLGLLPSNNLTPSAVANAIAADGRLIVGGSGDPFDQGEVAFVWTPDGGMRSLQDIVLANGLTGAAPPGCPSLSDGGLWLSVVSAASADGTVLLGQAVDTTKRTSSFVIHLPVSAYGL